MDTADKNSVKQWAKNTMDLNPDKGVITAVKEACEFFGLKTNESEIETIALDVMEWG